MVTLIVHYLGVTARLVASFQNKCFDGLISDGIAPEANIVIRIGTMYFVLGGGTNISRKQKLT